MIQEMDKEENCEGPAVPLLYWGPNGEKWAFWDLDKRKKYIFLTARIIKQIMEQVTEGNCEILICESL